MGTQDTSALEGLNLLELVPVRMAEWQEDGLDVVLELPAPTAGWRRPLKMFGYVMATKKIRLDTVGSYAWRMFDGRRTVSEVAFELFDQFGDSVAPAEERLGHLVQVLHRGGMIAYAGIDDGEADRR